MPFKETRHILKISDLTREELLKLIDIAIDMKAHEEKYYDRCKGKTVLSFFSKPSLRTHVSIYTAANKLGA